MSKPRSAILGLSVILLLLNTSVRVVTASMEDKAVRRSEGVSSPERHISVWLPILSQPAGPAPGAGASGMRVTLSAPYTTRSWSVREPGRPKFDLPLLYLHHERTETPKTDRTLEIKIVGLAAGTEVQVEAVSRHVDVSANERRSASVRFVSPERPCTAKNPCRIQWALDAGTTPSDFYNLRVKDGAGNLLWSNPRPDRPDFVMLDTWDVGLGEYTVRVYYATLFPFARGPEDLDNRLAPDAVTAFVEGRFVPIVVDTWNTQFHTWGFGDPIHPDWDRDKVVEIIMTSYPLRSLTAPERIPAMGIHNIAPIQNVVSGGTPATALSAGTTPWRTVARSFSLTSFSTWSSGTSC